MRILFVTDNRKAASTQLSLSLLEGLVNEPEVVFDAFNRNYSKYDAVIFMGYDPDIKSARAKNPNIKIGVMDPRPSFKVQPVGADFILAHGVEMEDWYLSFTPNVFRYYIYPAFIGETLREHVASDKIILAYHGNKKHLDEMSPRVTDAISSLAETVPVEFRVMYDISSLGKWTPKLSDKVALSLIQWSPENYDRYIATSDVGLVPGFTSYANNGVDYQPAYKITSNPGRIWVFAKYGIPVVADMFPSALQVIKDGQDGYVCCSSIAWADRLSRLVSPELRRIMGRSLRKKYELFADVKVMNKNLLDFLNRLSRPTVLK